MDHVDGDLVLDAVLVRRQQLGGPALVGLGVAGPRCGAGHRLGTHDVADPGDEQLRAGADEAVHREAQRRRVEASQAVQEGCRIQWHVGVDLQLPGEHDLGELAGPDALRRSGDRVGPVLGAHDAAHPHVVGCRHPVGVDGVGGGRDASPCAATVLTHRVPSAERPNTTAGTTRVAAARRSNGSAPKATGPDPGVRTSSSVGIDRSTSVTRPMWSVHGAGSSMRRASPTPLSPGVASGTP